jgi:hypothetical protein
MLVLSAATSACALLVQRTDSSHRHLLAAARPLTSTEIAAILRAVQEAITAKTFRLSTPLSQGSEVLMGRAGQPRIIRSAGAIIGGVVGGIAPGDRASTAPGEASWRREYIMILDYTRRQAPGCAESAEHADMVVEYEQDVSTQTWKTTARRRDARDFGGLGIAPMFEMLQGHGRIASGERRLIDGRWARAVTSLWVPPRSSFDPPAPLVGDPIPNLAGEPVPDDAVQTLWIDAESLLPRRWEISTRGSRAYGYDFRYQAFNLRAPVITPAKC